MKQKRLWGFQIDKIGKYAITWFEENVLIVIRNFLFIVLLLFLRKSLKGHVAIN